MKANFSEIINLYGIGVIVISCLFLFAFFFLHLITTKTRVNEINFISVFTGTLIMCISCWAILNTEGRTYLSISLFVFFILLYFLYIKNYFKQSNRRNTFSSLKVDFYSFNILYAVFFILQLLKVIDLRDFTLRAIHDDFAFYAGVSDFLLNYHKETIILDPNANFSWQPYHYFEMHFTALIAQITNFSSLKILYLVIYPILFSVSILTVVSFTKKIKLKSSLSIVIILFILFGNWSNTLNYLTGLDIFDDSSFLNKNGTKLAAYPIIIINLILHLKQVYSEHTSKQSITLRLFYLGLTTLIYPTSIPIVVFILVFSWLHSRLGNKLFLFITLILIASSISVLIINYKLRDLIFLTHPIQEFIAFSHIIIIFLFFQHYEKNRTSFIFSFNQLLSLFLGSYCFLIFLRVLSVLNIYDNPDSAQLYTNFFSVLVLIVLLLILLQIINDNKQKNLLSRLIMFSLIILGSVLNQRQIFSFYHPMINKMLFVKNLDSKDKVLIWDRPKSDFDLNTSNWFIYFTIPYSNTRWVSSNYFPVLKTLPDTSQIKKISQRYLFESVIKRASNYKNDYFNDFNSVNLDNLTKTN